MLTGQNTNFENLEALEIPKSCPTNILLDQEHGIDLTFYYPLSEIPHAPAFDTRDCELVQHDVYA